MSSSSVILGGLQEIFDTIQTKKNPQNFSGHSHLFSSGNFYPFPPSTNRLPKGKIFTVIFIEFTL